MECPALSRIFAYSPSSQYNLPEALAEFSQNFPAFAFIFSILRVLVSAYFHLYPSSAIGFLSISDCDNFKGMANMRALSLIFLSYVSSDFYLQVGFSPMNYLVKESKMKITRKTT